MGRVSIGLTFGKLAHLLDDGNLILIAWNEIKEEILVNCYKKTDINQHRFIRHR